MWADLLLWASTQLSSVEVRSALEPGESLGRMLGAIWGGTFGAGLRAPVSCPWDAGLTSGFPDGFFLVAGAVGLGT